jgi:hypothetical protein
MRLKDISYKVEFYWKGKRYRQVVRPINPKKGVFTIACRLAESLDSEWIDMPSGRKIKPVIRLV